MKKPTRKPRKALKKTSEQVKEFFYVPRRHVFFFDEGRFGLQSTVGRCWALRGERVLSPVNPGYQNFYLYSAVAPHTGKSFHWILPWVNTEIMSFYLRKFSMEYSQEKILLIMDQAGWHDSHNLICPDNISIKLLPPYSPELNPVEHLWQWLRRHVCRNRFFKSLDEMIDALCETIKTLTEPFLSSLCACNYL